MFSKTLTPANYYEDGTYLSSSALSNFCQFDFTGRPIYNFINFLEPVQPDSDAITIGSAVDAELTEGILVDDVYGPSLCKDELIDLCEQYGIEVRARKTKDGPADTMASLRAKLLQQGHVFLEEMPAKVYETVKNILRTAYKIQYDANTTYQEFIRECEGQVVITDEEWIMKGKFDHYNAKRGVIADLKTTGKFDKLLQELYYNGQVNIYHRYIRQLSIYRELMFRKVGKKLKCELIIIGYKGQAMILDIPPTALDAALEQVKKDIEVLNSYRFPGDPRPAEGLNNNYHIVLEYNPEAPVVNPFVEEEEEAVEDPLKGML